MSEAQITGNDLWFLKTLTKHVAVQLEERSFCLVFEVDLERCWPINQMPREKRNGEIYRFAESQGWSATIREGVFGTWAIFQRLEPDAVDHEGSPSLTN